MEWLLDHNLSTRPTYNSVAMLAQRNSQESTKREKNEELVDSKVSLLFTFPPPVLKQFVGKLGKTLQNKDLRKQERLTRGSTSEERQEQEKPAAPKAALKTGHLKP